MKRFTFTLIAALILLRPALPVAAEIVVLQSSLLRPYAEARAGVEKTLARPLPARGAKSIEPISIESHVLSEAKDLQRLKRRVVDSKPTLLIAIGGSALSLAEDLGPTPVIHLLVPNPEAVGGKQENRVGIPMAIPPALPLEALAKTLPAAKRIGLIHDPGQSAALVREATTTAQRLGLSLVVREAANSRQVTGLLAEMRGQVDAYWMVPDLTVLTPQTLEEILFFSIRNSIPVLTFNEKYLAMGAAIAVAFDAEAMGEQAGELAREVLLGKEIGSLPPSGAGPVRVEINRKVLRKMKTPFVADNGPETEK